MAHQRKQYIIDKKFQVKTTFTIISIVTVITALIIGAIAITVVFNNEKIKNLNVMQQANVEWLQSQINQSEKINDPVYKSATRQIAQNQQKSFLTIDSIFKINSILLIVLFIIVLAEGIILYIVLIRKTHKISGPIYVISNYIKEIINGNYPDPRPLRTKDELQDFYKLFSEMVQVVKERNAKK